MKNLLDVSRIPLVQIMLVPTLLPLRLSILEVRAHHDLLVATWLTEVLSTKFFFNSIPLGSELRIPSKSDLTYAAVVCKGAR